LPTERTERLHTLDALRGLAALGVTWFHLTNGNETFLPPGPVKASGAYGWMGVEIFFVISGFIIPLSLHRAGYRLRDYGAFVLKRMLRLDPPYVVALLVTIAVGYLASHTPGFRGQPYAVSLPQFFLHLGYLNVFFGYPWLNPVFWTLAIELQFYLAIGLLFPLLVDPAPARRVALLGAVALLAILLPSRDFIFHYAFLFVAGLVTFQYRIGLVNRRVFLAVLAVLAAAIAATMETAWVAPVAVLTSAAIAFADVRNRLLTFLGSISYSLYLIHVPFGGRVVNLGQRFAHDAPSRLAVLALALALSIAGAYALFRLVESPSQRWASRRVRFGRSAPSRSPVADAVLEQRAAP